MPLKLKIISPSALPSGQVSEIEFDELGGTIGRKPNNDFILIDPERFISSKHASIEYRNGKYFITDTSTNGVFINNAKQPVGTNNSEEIMNGDKISIGDFQMIVELESQSADLSPEPIWQSESTGFPQSTPPSSAEPFDLIGSTEPGPAGNLDDVVDPLALLDGGSQAPSTPAPIDQDLSELLAPTPGISSNDQLANDVNPAHAMPPEAEHDFFANAHEQIPEPEPVNELFSPPSAIPDNWDIMSDEESVEPQTQQPAAPSPVAGEQIAAPVSVIPDDDIFGDDIFSSLSAEPSSVATPTPQPKPQVPPQSQRPATRPETPQPTAPQTVPKTPKPVEPQVQKPAPRPAPQAAVTSSPTAEQADDLLNAFFEGAGINAQQLSFADKKMLMKKVGQLTRINTEGLIIALRARTTIKSSFRVNKTTIAPVENNPLKFLVTTDDALNTLLSDDRQGYMPAVQAFEEGFTDLQTHQMAMMAGMQATIRAIVNQFDPKSLEHMFVNQGGSSLIPVSKKSKNWDHYIEFYKKLSDRLMDDFQNVFGEEFARAYELQIQKLTNSGIL